MKFAHIVCVNTKNKKKVEEFEEHFIENIYKIREKLISKNYIPGKYNIFFIHEPKLRLIMSQNIEDKIINHLVAYYFLVNTFEPTFIDTTVATRVGRGTHYGLNVLKKYINQMKRKHRDNFYYLKFDIKKYFHNLDHDIIKSIIRTKIKDKDALNLLDKLIDSTDEEYINKQITNLKKNEISRINKLNISQKEKDVKIEEVNKIPLCSKGKSSPIGSMCSQTIAIIYLDKLNHFIKEQLHIKKYILYMDDGLLIHEDKEYLKMCMYEIKEYLKSLKLELNTKKTTIDSIKNGIDFLGFNFYLKNNKLILKVRNSTKKNFKKKIKRLNKLYFENKITDKDRKCVIDSYIGHLSYGDCNNLLKSNLNNTIEG
jgi:retron-type reverse transcriptase